jgi:hypothetical protein
VEAALVSTEQDRPHFPGKRLCVVQLLIHPLLSGRWILVVATSLLSPSAQVQVMDRRDGSIVATLTPFD